MKKTRDADSKTFKQATANMNFKEKVNYIREYYWMWIVGPLVVAIALGLSIHAALTTRNVYFNISFVHGFTQLLEDNSNEPRLGIWRDEQLANDILEVLIEEGEYDNYFIMVQGHDLSNHNFFEAFTMFAAVGELDIIITYSDDFSALNEIGHFRNLTEFEWDIPAHMFYNDYGLNLRYLPFFENRAYGGEYEIILGVATNSENLDRIEHFIRRILKY